MATDRLKKWRASAPAGEVQLDCLTLKHPAFSQDWHFTNNDQGFDAIIDGQSITTLVHPFKAKLPDIDTTGRQDLQLDIFNSGPQFVAELQAAAQATVQIDCAYHVFFEPDTSPEETITLALTSVAITPKAASATARWADPLNRKFPSLFYRTDTFPGLSR